MTVAWPQPAVGRTAEPIRPDLPLQAMLIGAAVPAAVASAAWWLAVPYVAVVAAVGVVIGAVLAFVASPRLGGPDWLGASIGLGLVAPLVPGVCIALVFGLGGLAAVMDTGFEAAVGGLAFAAIALVVALVGGIPITLPIAVVVGFMVRRAATMSPRRARRHVVALGIGTALLALPTLAVAVARGDGAGALGPMSWASLGGEVPLTVTVENHTPQDRTLDVSWDMGDGATNGLVTGVGGCTVASDRLSAGGAWVVTEIGPDGEPVGPVIARSTDWPSDAPAITIVFAADGRVLVQPGALVLSEDALDVAAPVLPCG